MKPTDFTTGQTVFIEVRDTRHAKALRPMNVSTIGRKWVNLGGWEKWRFDPEDMAIDGGQYSSPGRVWLSEEDCTARREATVAWNAVARRISPNAAPEGMTLARVREIAALCGIDLEAAMKQDAR